MKWLMVVLVLLSACAAQREQHFVWRCTNAGFPPETPGHDNCVRALKLDFARGR